MEYQFREFRIAELIAKKWTGQISDAEIIELNEWLEESPQNLHFYNTQFTKANIDNSQAQLDNLHSQEAELLYRIHSLIAEQTLRPKHQIYKRLVLIAAAAAVIVAIIFNASRLWTVSQTTKAGGHLPIAKVSDVLPGGSKAMLILADGSHLALDSLQTGKIAQQGASSISKLDSGTLSYEGSQGAGAKEVTFNTLVTPRAGQFEVRLPDGTKVWLNNASRLRYPTTFTDSREVELEGEAYFDVAKNMSAPFTVKTRGQRIEVLGTEFNVSSYPDEKYERTTLVTGKVRVDNGSHAKVLSPGAQGISADSTTLKVLDVDIYAVTSWRRGVFSFDNADIQSVMRQLSRWYDISVVFDEKANKARAFDGAIDRGLALSEVVTILRVNNIKTVLNGRTLTIVP